MKFRAHETFSIRKGWLHKGINAITNNPKLFVDKNINTQDELGIGANMVKSLRYWLQATGLVKEEIGKGMSLTEVGKVIAENDSYFEEDGTLLLVHYLLSSNEKMATSWYYVFNEMNTSTFDKNDFLEYITIYAQNDSENKIPSERVISDDYECVIKTYFNSKENVDPESNFICPLTELGLIIESDNSSTVRAYSKSMPEVPIHNYIALGIIINEATKNGQNDEIKISSIERDKCNLGKTFNLDYIAISECLDKLQNLDLIKVVRTAGLDVIRIKTNLSFVDCIQKYYDSIK